MSTEQWAPVPDFPGYSVSSFGEVRGSRGWLLKPWVDRKGYQKVSLYREGRRANFLVSRLVLLSFVGPGDGLDACHNNGDQADNRLSNLRWDTRAENIRDQLRHGTHVNGRKTHCNQGHEFTPENTYPGRPYRVCITCARERAALQYRERDSA